VSYSGGGGDGTPVAQDAVNPDSATLSASEPGTVGHDLLAFVCAHAKQGGTDRHAAVAGKASERSYSSAKTRPGS
jgi:hypothetical protein